MIAPYLDASAIIYLVEGTASAQALVARRIAGVEQDPAGRVLTSHLSRLECREKPLRASDAALLSTYDAFFTRARLEVLDISAAVIDRATDSSRAVRVQDPRRDSPRVCDWSWRRRLRDRRCNARPLRGDQDRHRVADGVAVI